MIGPGKGVRPQEGLHREGDGYDTWYRRTSRRVDYGRLYGPEPTMEKKVGMLGVTEKSFGHLSGRYDVAGGTIGG
jgi:hypothetical protein